MYAVLYADATIDEISPSGRKCTHVKCLGRDILGSCTSRTRRSAFIAAFWTTNDGNIGANFSVTDSEWPGVVNYYIQHTVYVDDQPITHLLANVSWYSPTEDRTRFHYAKPVEVWQKNAHVQLGASSYIPVQRIKCKFLQAPVTVRNRRHYAKTICLLIKLFPKISE